MPRAKGLKKKAAAETFMAVRTEHEKIAKDPKYNYMGIKKRDRVVADFLGLNESTVRRARLGQAHFKKFQNQLLAKVQKEREEFKRNIKTVPETKIENTTLRKLCEVLASEEAPKTLYYRITLNETKRDKLAESLLQIPDKIKERFPKEVRADLRGRYMRILAERQSANKLKR